MRLHTHKIGITSKNALIGSILATVVAGCGQQPNHFVYCAAETYKSQHETQPAIMKWNDYLSTIYWLDRAGGDRASNIKTMKDLSTSHLYSADGTRYADGQEMSSCRIPPKEEKEIASAAIRASMGEHAADIENGD